MSQPTTISAPPGSPVTDMADLKRKSVRGGMITFVSQGISIVLQLTSTVILARLLSPDDYGVMAMVVAVTSFAGLFRDLGLSAAAIQKHTLTNAQQSNLFWMNVALGSVLTMTLALASPLVVWFYHKPEVLWVTVALSASFLIGSLSAQSGALLVRQMRFGRQAVANIGGALVGLSVSVTLAFKGFRYWSLVWGQLASGLTITSLLFILSPFRPGLPSRGTGLKEMLKFGAHITAFDFVNYFHRNLDNVLIGRYWGAEPLGVYSRAYQLLMFPINNLRGPINAIAFPALSRLQNQPEAFRAYYLRVTSLLALVSMPLTAFLFVESKPIVELLLGSQWIGVVPIFSCLALAAFIQPVSGFAGSLMMSLGQGRRYLQCGTFNTITYVASFIVGLRWGPVGVALSYAIVNYLFLYPWMSWVFRCSPVSFGDFVNACALPAIASLVSAGVLTLVMPYIAIQSPVANIFVDTIAFMAIFIPIILLTASGKDQITFIARIITQIKIRK